MRRLTILVTILSLLFSGYWVLVARTLTGQTGEVLGQLETEGWQVQHAGLGTGGFPFSFDTRLQDATVSDPSGQIGWTGAEVAVSAPSYWPTEVTATLPDAQQLTIGGELVDITSTRMQASAAVAASTDVPLTEAIVEGRDVTITHTSGWMLELSELQAALVDDDTAPAYTTTANLSQLVVPDLASFASAAGLPAAIDVITLDGMLRFAAPLDRFSLSAQLPPVTRITVRSFEIVWGDAGLHVEGAVAPQPSGNLSGSLTITVRNWERLLNGAISAGLVPADSGPTYLASARMLSGGSADLTAPLTIDDGAMRIGFIPLGRLEF